MRSRTVTHTQFIRTTSPDPVTKVLFIKNRSELLNQVRASRLSRMEQLVVTVELSTYLRVCVCFVA